MSRYWNDDEIERRIARGLVVQEFGRDDVDLFDYIALASGWD